MDELIDEICKIIAKKMGNANVYYNREWSRKYPSKQTLAELKGNMDAYTDCLNIIKDKYSKKKEKENEN